MVVVGSYTINLEDEYEPVTALALAPMISQMIPLMMFALLMMLASTIMRATRRR